MAYPNSAVVDSVQQIVNECKEMLAHTEHCEYYDILSLGKTLREEVGILEQLFEFTPGETDKIKAQKQVVERLAIRLEFFLMVRMHLYQERKQLRDFAGKFFNDCKDITSILNKKGKSSERELLKWAGHTGYAMSLYARSLHIVFELSDDDNECIKMITAEMNNAKEDFINE